MDIFQHFYHFLHRLRYPASLPEEVANALGVPLANTATFEEFVNQLTNPESRPKTLVKFMRREKAEAAFHNALRKEKFQHSTHFSFYFNEGWVEFILLFDEECRLRRLYLQHKEIPSDEGVEIPLAST